jgi:type III pantothenate kinase
MKNMLFVIDVGNTNIVLGMFEGERLLKDWRIRTEPGTTEDEFCALTTILFTGGGVDTGQIEKTVISCVVPPMVPILEAFCRKYLGHSPVWISARTITNMPIRYDNPGEVGADRLVNAVAAFEKFKTGLIVIDFGTATTFDVVSPKGEYLGGAISPGIAIASEALYSHASKLPRVEIFERPRNVIGKNTSESIQSGIIFGYAGMVDGIVGRFQKEMGGALKVVATGGLAPLMQNVSETIETVEPALTLEGLRILGEKVTVSPTS